VKYDIFIRFKSENFNSNVEFNHVSEKDFNHFCLMLEKDIKFIYLLGTFINMEEILYINTEKRDDSE